MLENIYECLESKFSMALALNVRAIRPNIYSLEETLHLPRFLIKIVK